MQKTRFRIRFTKTGDLRWISHRDLARVWERLLRRSTLQLAFSQGFHPKPKISFPSALALGIEALEEVVEIEVEGDMRLEDVAEPIRREMPAGMQMLSIESMPPGSPKAQVIAHTFRVELPPELRSATQTRLDEIHAQPTLSASREGKTIVVKTDDPYFQVHVDDAYLHFTLPASREGAMRPLELLQSLGLGDLLEQGALLQRVHLWLQSAAAADAQHHSLAPDSPDELASDASVTLKEN